MANHQARFSALDGIRGVAAIAVLLFHCGLILDLPWVMGHGGLAVDVFFIMSGFVVADAYGPRLEADWSIREFGLARIRRLYPLYAMGTILGLILTATRFAIQGTPFLDLALAITFVSGALLIPIFASGMGKAFPLNGPSWSLLMEAIVSVAYASTAKRLKSWSLALVIAIGAATILVAAYQKLSLQSGGRPATLWVDLARATYAFGMGLLIRRRHVGVGPPSPPSRATVLLLMGVCCLLAVPRQAADAWLDPIGILVLAPLVVFIAVRCRPSPSIANACARIGAISYPLYTLHIPILDFVLSNSTHVSTAWRTICIFGAAVFSIILASAVSRWLKPAASGFREKTDQRSLIGSNS